MKSSSILSTLLGLAFLAAVVYALFYAARFGAGLFGEMSPGTAARAAAALTLLAAAAIVGNGLHAIGRHAALREQRAAQAAAYERFLLFRSDGPATDARGRFPDDAAASDQQMLLFASPAVLSACLRLRRAEEGGAKTRAAAQEELVELVRAMRRDLGRRSPEVGLAELTELLGAPARTRSRVGTSDVMHG